MIKTEGPPVPKTPASLAGIEAKPGDVIKIGLLHSLSGTMALSEKSLMDAEQMAIDEINRAGGVLECRIEPVVADGASLPERFAQAAQYLLAAGVSALFGCWTSASRKAVRPVVEADDSLLWYPVQYEGLEESSCICYSGSCLNQQIMPAVEWALEQFGNRLFLLGSDYVFPRTANQLIRSLVAGHGGSIVGERYVALGARDFGEVIAQIRQTQPSAVINTLNGDSNLAFYQHYRAADILPAQIPIVATSVTETELESVTAAAAGHFACWSYFQSLDTPENRAFVSRFKGRYGENRLVSAPAVTAYIQVYLWKQAVERAGAFTPSEVRRRLPGCVLLSPMGELRIEANHHLSMPVRIGRLNTDGQFEIVWRKDELIAPLPWLGVEKMDFPGREMVLQSLAAFSEGVDRGCLLEREIGERKVLEAALEKAQAELEWKVDERTLQLVKTIADLRQEDTARQRAEDGLAISEKRFRDIADHAQEWIWEVDAEGKYTYASQVVEKILGYTPAEILQKHFYDLFHPEDRESLRAAAFEAFAGKQPFREFINRNVHKNGQTVWLATSGLPLFDEQGSLLGYRGVDTDITERKQVEAALRESHELFSLFMRHSPIYTYIKAVTSTESRVMQASDNFQQMIGIPGRDMIGKTMAELFPAEFAAKITAEDWSVVANGEVLRLDEDLNGRNYTSIKFPIVRGDKTLLAGYTIDITDRKGVEMALRESEERYRTLFDRANDGIFILSNDGKLISVNESLARMHGYSANEMLQMSLRDLDTPESARLIPERMRRLQAGEALTFEVEHYHKDGHIFPLEVSASLISSGGKSFIQSFHRDITERKRAEAEKAMLQAQFQQAQKLDSIGQLAGGVAHDFNNMLAATMMHLSCLQEHPNLDAEMQESLKELMVEAQRAATLTRQLLMFSRRSVLEIKVLDLNEVVASLLRMLGRLIGEQITVQFDCRSGLPPVAADAGMIEQVVMNLVVNARDAMPKGGRLTIGFEPVQVYAERLKGRLEVRPGPFVCLSVADTGCGMDEATLKRIFEPFFTTKEVGKGTGLGLAAVHGIVAQHKGWVDVESEPGHGTTFRVFLPATTKGTAEPVQNTKTEVSRGHETILLVEDEAGVQRAVAQGLRRLGYRVLEAGNGQAAMNVWLEQAGQVDLLFTDMVMPEGLTGLDLAMKLQAEKPNLKVIISSGYNMELVGQGKPTAGGIVYLQKPYHIEVLSQTVRECLDRP